MVIIILYNMFTKRFKSNKHNNNPIETTEVEEDIMTVGIFLKMKGYFGTYF